MVRSNVGDSALTTAAGLSSRFCGCEGAYARRAWFAKSATGFISVKNKGGKSFHPLGRVRGVDTSGLEPSSTGKMRPSF